MKQAIRQQSQHISSLMKSQQQQVSACTVCDSATELNSEKVFNQIHRSFRLSNTNYQQIPKRTISIDYKSPAQIERMKYYSSYGSTSVA